MTVNTSTGADNRVLISVTIQQNELAEKTNKAINKYRKNLTMPGFRKGHAPEGLVRKQYGDSIKFEELNTLLREGVNQYVNEHSKSIMITPIPVEQDNLDLKAEEMVFEFETIVKPELNLDLSSLEVTGYQVEVTDEEVDALIEKYRKQVSDNAEPTSVQTISSATRSLKLLMSWEEIDAPSEVTLQATDFEPAFFETLHGKNVDDSFTASSKEMFTEKNWKNIIDGHALGSYLIAEEEVTLTLVIVDVYELPLIENGAEFYTQLFGPDTDITTVEAMKERLKTDMNASYSGDINNYMFNEVTELLLAKYPIEIPRETVRRAISENGQEVTDEVVQSNIDSLRWTMIDSTLREQFDITVKREEIREYLFANFVRQIGGMQLNDQLVELVNQIVDKDMEKNEKVEDAAYQISAGKITEVYRNNCKINWITVTPTDFQLKIQEQKERLGS